MARYSAYVLAALLLAPAYGRAAEACERSQGPPQPGTHPGDSRTDTKRVSSDSSPHQPPPKWWIDPQLRAELGITDPQSAAVDAVWQKSLPPLREARQRLDKLETALAAMSETSDEASVIAQIEKVENTRAELNKGRTLMLYRMNRVLTPEQRAKVRAMFEHRDGNRREPPR